MSNSSAVVAAPGAYAKVFLHAFKYPSQPVMGLLVGKRLSSGERGSCYVMDTVPLFHAEAMTAPHPMLEVALAHVQFSAKAAGVTVLGLYVANERLDDHAISKELTLPLLNWLRTRLASSSNEVTSSSSPLLLWFIDNEAATGDMAVTPLFFDGKEDICSAPIPRPAQGSVKLTFGRWNSDTLVTEPLDAQAGMELLTNALEVLATYRLCDFEDHLENPQRQYLEQSIEELMRREEAGKNKAVRK